MAFEIPDHFNRQFTHNFELLLQEKKPVFENAVNTAAYQGEAAQVVKQFGEVEFAEKTTRHSDTEFADLQHKQRWVFPTDWTLALPVDKEDEIRQLDSPLSPYTEAMRAAWARKTNAVIRDALLGDAKTGKNGSTTTSFDTSNQQIAAGGGGMTVAKLRTARRIFTANEVDAEDPLSIAVKAKQIDDMLAITEVGSYDYNSLKPLVSGSVDSFMGFKFIPYQKLSTVSTDDRVMAWAKSGIVLGVWNAMETRIGERPDKEYTTQVFMRGTLGATRTQEKKVIEILCNQ